MGIESIIEEAARFGLKLKPTAADAGGSVRRWTCKCVKCNTELVTSFKAMCDPPRIVAGIEQKGWEFHRNQPVCPICVAKAKEERKMNTTSKVENVANPKLQRKVYALLDEHFDEATRLYNPGWSDKKVADAAETSEQFVTNVRRGAYGELAEDPAVTSIRNEISALSTEAKKLTDELFERMGQIEKKIVALDARLDGLSMKKVV